MKKFPVKISSNITFAEAVKSKTAEANGISNYPDEDQLENMKFIALNIFEVVREKVADNKPIIVSSFFRTKDLNEVVPGASKNSQHSKGEAMDLQKTDDANYTNRNIFEFIRDNLDFDQLIWERGDTTEPKWVHVSLKKEAINRKQIIYKLR